jgi:hypothetical protein
VFGIAYALTQFIQRKTHAKEHRLITEEVICLIKRVNKLDGKLEPLEKNQNPKISLRKSCMSMESETLKMRVESLKYQAVEKRKQMTQDSFDLAVGVAAFTVSIAEISKIVFESQTEGFSIVAAMSLPTALGLSLFYRGLKAVRILSKPTSRRLVYLESKIIALQLQLAVTVSPRKIGALLERLREISFQFQIDKVFKETKKNIFANSDAKSSRIKMTTDFRIEIAKALGLEEIDSSGNEILAYTTLEAGDVRKWISLIAQDDQEKRNIELKMAKKTIREKARTTRNEALRKYIRARTVAKLQAVIRIQTAYRKHSRSLSSSTFSTQYASSGHQESSSTPYPSSGQLESMAIASITLKTEEEEQGVSSEPRTQFSRRPSEVPTIRRTSELPSFFREREVPSVPASLTEELFMKV